MIADFSLRRRHVKCDESKPACKRCIKWRGHCDGYEDLRSNSRTPEAVKAKSQTKSPPEKEKGKEREKVKVPRWYRALVTESSKLASRPQDVCVPQEQKQDNLTDNEGASSSAEPTRRNSFDETFWQSTVPYLLRRNTAVWYANLAIHALIDSKRPTWVEDAGGHSSDSFRRALKYHGLALSQLRKEAITRSALQSATLCCLFFVVFEMMNGDDKAAQAHMYNGCKMMSEIQKNATGQVLSNSEVDAMLNKELQKALRFVASQVNGPSQRSSQDGPGTPGEDRTGSVASMTTVGSVASVASSDGGGSTFSMEDFSFGPSQF